MQQLKWSRVFPGTLKGVFTKTCFEKGKENNVISPGGGAND